MPTRRPKRRKVALLKGITRSPVRVMVARLEVSGVELPVEPEISVEDGRPRRHSSNQTKRRLSSIPYGIALLSHGRDVLP